MRGLKILRSLVWYSSKTHQSFLCLEFQWRRVINCSVFHTLAITACCMWQLMIWPKADIGRPGLQCLEANIRMPWGENVAETYIRLSCSSLIFGGISYSMRGNCCCCLKKKHCLWFTGRMVDTQIWNIGPISIYLLSPSSLQYFQGIWGTLVARFCR